MRTRELRNAVLRRNFFVARDFETAPVDAKRALGAKKLQIKCRSRTGRGLAVRPDGRVGRLAGIWLHELEQGVLGVGRFAVVFQREPPTAARNGCKLAAEIPIDYVERVMA